LVLSFSIFIIPLLVINKTCGLLEEYFSFGFLLFDCFREKKWTEGEEETTWKKKKEREQK
jgi:hypothetical protein